MSTGKGADISIGGRRISSSGGGLAALTALGTAATATVGLMQQAIKAAHDEKERAEIEKRKSEITALQSELDEGRRAAERFSENVKTWRLKAKCKALNARLDCVGKRAAASGLTLSIKPAPPLSSQANKAELAEALAQLEQNLKLEEAALRQAVTKAVEEHAAQQGVNDAIDRMAALPAPPLQTPADLLGYLEESEALQLNRRNAAALATLHESLQRALAALPERVPQITLDAIGERVAEFARTTHEVQADGAHLRVMELIKQAKSEALSLAPLFARKARACELASDLVYAQLPEADQQFLAEDDAIPDAGKMAALEDRLRRAQAEDAARIFDQQRRFALAATLDTLQSLGYDTSVLEEATWFKKGMMFISRPEWGEYVVRLTLRQGKIILYAGRYVEDASWQDASKALTPEMENLYRKRIDDWCRVHLPRLVEALEHQRIGLEISELQEDVNKIQRVSRSEIGDALAVRIETRVGEKKHPADVRNRSREA